MLTCEDDDAEWTYQCCLCGTRGPVVHCEFCGHDFCGECKANYYWRGKEAVKSLLGRSNLYCGGERHA